MHCIEQDVTYPKLSILDGRILKLRQFSFSNFVTYFENQKIYQQMKVVDGINALLMRYLMYGAHAPVTSQNSF